MSTRTEQFEELVHNATEAWHINLSRYATYHLVDTLITHTRDQNLFIYAVSTFVTLTQEQKSPAVSFVINGDRCLLLVGLFPACIQRKGLRVDNYISMGRKYYAQARSSEPAALNEYYESIISEFSAMAHTLQVMRSLH